jgi:hypothetical protein
VPKSFTSQLLRTQSATYIVEVAVILFVLFFLIALPLVDLATFTMRASLLSTCARDAAFHAAKAKSFVSDISSTNLSAKSIANRIALMEAAAFSDISVESVQTSVLITNLDTKEVSRQLTVLTLAPNTDQYVYQIEVSVTGRVKPLLLFSKNWFGDIPGLTDWIPVTVRSREYCENPQGLML